MQNSGFSRAIQIKIFLSPPAGWMKRAGSVLKQRFVSSDRNVWTLLDLPLTIYCLQPATAK